MGLSSADSGHHALDALLLILADVELAVSLEELEGLVVVAQMLVREGDVVVDVGSVWVEIGM